MKFNKTDIFLSLLSAFIESHPSFFWQSTASFAFQLHAPVAKGQIIKSISDIKKYPTGQVLSICILPIGYHFI